MAVQELNAYYFHEEDWDSYDELHSSFEWEVPDTFNIADYALDRWADDKHRVAFFAEDEAGNERTYTYWQASRITNRLANYLTDRGIEAGDRVGVSTSQNPEGVFAHFACWKIGAISVPLSTLFGPEALEYRLNDCSASACIVDEVNLENFRDVRPEVDTMETVLTVGDVDPLEDEADFWTGIAEEPPAFENAETDPDDGAIIAYTSGSTGDPKGVYHAHRVLLGYLPPQITGFFNMDVKERDVIWTPIELAWAPTLCGVVLAPMFYGRPIVLYDQGSFDPENALRIIEKYGVTLYYATPTAIRMKAQVEDIPERFDVSQLRLMYTGGESVDASIRDWLNETFEGAVLHEAYGQTECNPLIAECTALNVIRDGKMGKPLLGRDIDILDAETAEPLDEPGEVGEIAVRTEGLPAVMKEYWNKPEKTENKFSGEWMLTEDLGIVDEDDYYAFVERKDFVIISSGYRVAPQEIEDTLSHHEAVVEAGVIPVDHEVRGQVPKAFVKLAEGVEESDELAEEIQQFVKDELAKYEYPRELEFVDRLPRTSTEKIDRNELADREAAS